MTQEERERMEAIALFADAVTSLHDPRENGHQNRCVELSIELAFKLGLSHKEIETIGWAAHFHDIGKLGIPESILSKEVLSDSEVDQVHGHAVNGADVVAVIKIEGIAEISTAIRNHHENWDGTGYPDKLSFEEIPIAAQVIRIVDFFDAVTMDRVYRKKISIPDALILMESKSGSWINPKMFNVFKKIIKNEP